MTAAIPSRAFRQVFPVPSDAIDNLGHVNNVVYVQWVQDVADAHWKTTDPSLQAACRWVVLRHEIDYKMPALPGDTIEAITWVEPRQGATSIRNVWITRHGNGDVLAMAKTTWCLLDPVTHRPKRIGQEIDRSLGLED